MSDGPSRSADQLCGKVSDKLFPVLISLARTLVRSKVSDQFRMKGYRLFRAGELADDHPFRLLLFARQELGGRIDLNADHRLVVSNRGKCSQNVLACFFVIDHASNLEQSGRSLRET